MEVRNLDQQSDSTETQPELTASDDDVSTFSRRSLFHRSALGLGGISMITLLAACGDDDDDDDEEGEEIEEDTNPSGIDDIDDAPLDDDPVGGGQ